MNQELLLLLVLFLGCSTFSCISASDHRDTITQTSPLVDPETLVSASDTFELGFFSPSVDATYIVICYKFDPEIVVWVGNRDDPIEDYQGDARLAIVDGNLVLEDRNGFSYWSTGLDDPSVPPSRNVVVTAQILDSGNLVLTQITTLGTKKIVWQSFDKPADTFLPGMKMEGNLNLASWNRPSSPSTGLFRFGMIEEGENRYAIWKRSTLYWISRNVSEFHPLYNLIPVMIKDMLSNSPHQGTNSSFVYRRLVMSISGEIQLWSWNGTGRIWDLTWNEPTDGCSISNACGKFGVCNINNDPICACLSGFKPVSNPNWKGGDFSGGCWAGPSSCERYKFLNYSRVKVGRPDSVLKVENETVCKTECDCQCRAYSYDANVTTSHDSGPDGNGVCWIWRNEVNDLQEEYNGGRTLYVRVPLPDKGSGSSEPTTKNYLTSRELILIVVGTIIVGVAIVACVVYYFILQRINKRKQGTVALQRTRFGSASQANHLIETSEFKEEDRKEINLPFFELESILEATDNFSTANKLGQGGYGPVYKGTFPGGQEIAVKRLSSASGQGLHEFKNEVVLIAKLQHRNLVKLRGYCVKGDEKILIYEYMPNKSLDRFIFGNGPADCLNWEMRLNIIVGIARGLLYLHQDSRLRIIHRDMKTSNILLDGEMNPKISNFGLAKIVGRRQGEINTSRVVGTYGYMAPEYALNGILSLKSDVFSFGVVILEIISGKRTTGYSLIENAWKIWREGDAMKLMDERLEQTCNTNEFLKCVQVGLLCVEEQPGDRPDTAALMMMLGSESQANLPNPRRPALAGMGTPSGSAAASSSATRVVSRNYLTNSSVQGR